MPDRTKGSGGGRFFALLFCAAIFAGGGLHLFQVFRGTSRGVADAGRGFVHAAGLGVFGGMERKITESSPLAAFSRRLWGEWMLGWFREGNNRVLIRPGNWLFYRPGIQSLIGPGPLRPMPLVVSRPAPQEDWPMPGAAIARFSEELRGRGIRLLIVPIPDKAAALAPGRPPGRCAAHPHAREFYESLREDGVGVLRLEGLHEPHFWLRSDTHWSGEGALFAAKKIAEQIRQILSLPEGGADFREEERKGRGDLAVMLGEAGEARFTAERTAVYAPQPQPGNKEPAGPRVIWLGDSFTNIYRDASLGFGSTGGVASLCAALVGEPFRVFAVNGGGATACRRNFTRSTDAVRSARLVVWAIAERELFLGEKLSRELGIRWDDTPLPAADEATDGDGDDGRSEGLIEIEGVATVVSKLPDPAVTPYADCLMVVAYDVPADSGFSGGRLLAVHRGFENRALLPASTIRAGERHRLRVRPFDSMPPELQSRQKADETEDILPLYWVEEWERR